MQPKWTLRFVGLMIFCLTFYFNGQPVEKGRMLAGPAESKALIPGNELTFQKRK